MKELHLFIADDGTVFKNRYDCEMHEFKQKAKSVPPIRGFNCYGNEMAEISGENIHDCYFMLIEDERQFDRLYLIEDQYGETIPENDGLGIYIWSNSGEWLHINNNFTHFSLSTFL